MSEINPDQPAKPDLAALIRAVGAVTSRRNEPAIPDMPQFPAGLLPEPVAAWLGAAAAATRIHPECVVMPFLALTGALVGNRAALDVGLGWTEYPLLWVALVAPSGGGKTPAIAAASHPFRELETTLGTGSPGLITAETAPTRLADTLAARPGIALIQDELVGVVRALNGSRRADDRQRMLSLWSSHPAATSPAARQQGAPPAIPIPVVGIVGGVQTRVVPRLRSRDQDGFIERFVPIVTNPVAVYWSESRNARRPEPDLPAIVDWLTPLATLDPRDDGGNGNAASGKGCLHIQRSPEAASIWGAWYNGNVDRCYDAPQILRGFYLKLPAQVARLALILHLLWNPRSPGQPLSASTMQRAVDLGEFIRVHIHRLSLLLGHTGTLPAAPSPTLEQRVLRILAETGNPEGWVSRTDLHIHGGRPSRKELAAVLDSLIARRIVASRTERPAGPGRPLTVYRLA
ncbi:MAG: DUF3987 domain-containing protein [Thermomicrobiales bacterium]